MRKTVSTDQAPAAIGPYAQANIFGDLIFTSGQIPLDPATGQIVGSTIEEQTIRSLKISKPFWKLPEASGQGSENDCIYQGHERLWKNERDLRSVLYRKQPSFRSAVEVARFPKGRSGGSGNHCVAVRAN